jgi:O-antigen ligase
MIFAQLATFSRSALLALLFCLVFILIFSVIKKDKLTFYVVIKYFIIMLMAAWAFNMYYPNLWASRFDLNNRLEAKSVQDRQMTYSQLTWENPRIIIFGQGLGLNTYQAYQKNRPTSVDQVQPIHNWFLLALAEIGLMGVLIFLGLLYFYFKKILWKKNNYQVWNTAFVLLLIFLGLFDHYLWTSWTGWLMVGVVIAIIYHNKE